MPMARYYVQKLLSNSCFVQNAGSVLNRRSDSELFTGSVRTLVLR